MSWELSPGARRLPPPSGEGSYELGALSFDTIESRDGTGHNGDLVSISGMDVKIRVGGGIELLAQLSTLAGISLLLFATVAC